MDADLLLDAIGLVDSELVLRAREVRSTGSAQGRKRLWIAGIAACLALAVLVPVVWRAAKQTMSDGYTVYQCSFTDGVPHAENKMEYPRWSEGSYISRTQPKEITLTVNGKAVHGTYCDSGCWEYNDYPSHRYEDDHGNYFEVDDEGALVAYFWGTPEAFGAQRYTQEECVEKARAFLETLLDTTPYRVSVEKEEATDTFAGRYIVTFRTYIGELETADQAVIAVWETGELYWFSSWMLGRIPQDTSVPFDMEIVHDAVYEKVEAIYQNVKDDYDGFSYDTSGVVLTLDEHGNAMLVYYVDVEFRQNAGEYVLKCGDRLGFVVVSN